MKRIIYLGYYIKQMNWQQLNSFLNYTTKLTNKNRFIILTEAIRCVFIYNISILEYFQFRFFEKNNLERKQWAGTGFMYEAVLKLNPIANRQILSDKRIFLEYYKDFVNHWHVTLSELEQNSLALNEKLNGYENKIVLKSSSGQCGEGLIVKELNDSVNAEILIKELRRTGNDIVEQFVEQHTDLSCMSSSGLNTLRIFTIINSNGQVDILGARLRITINSHIDNLAAGNIACEVDLNTGKIIGPGVYSDITKKDIYQHPVSGIEIVGFQVPYFFECIELVKKAALFDITNKTVGWDVAITNNGVELIEGNHNWCKLLWQLPAKKGLKSELEKYL
jgi:hypothetical protein